MNRPCREVDAILFLQHPCSTLQAQYQSVNYVHARLVHSEVVGREVIGPRNRRIDELPRSSRFEFLALALNLLARGVTHCL